MLTLTQDEQAIADGAMNVLNKMKAVLGAIAGSPLTAEMEQLIPGLVPIVAKIGLAATTAGIAAAAIPVIEEIAALYQAGIIQGADQAFFDRREALGGGGE